MAISQQQELTPSAAYSATCSDQLTQLGAGNFGRWGRRAPGGLVLELRYATLRIHLMASVKLFADETTAPVLDPGRGLTKTGQSCANARDDRPWDERQRPGQWPPPETGPGLAAGALRASVACSRSTRSTS